MKKLSYLIFFSLLMMLLFCAAAYADQLTVGRDGEYRSLTDAAAAASDGDEIIISEGTYDESVETFPIIIDKLLYIHGADSEEAVFDSTTLNAVIKVTEPKCVIENLGIRFIRSGIWVLADDVAVQNCSFVMSDDAWRETSCAMWVGGAKYMTLTGCDFEGCGIAVAGPEVTPGKTGIPVLTAMFEVGEDIEFFTTHTIENNTVNGKPLLYVMDLRDTDFSEPCGQILAVNCENVTFKDMDVTRASIGMEMAYCKDIRIIDSTADECGVFGIYVCKTEDCLIENVQANYGAHGIDVRGTERCMVTHCTADYNGQGIFYSYGWDCMTSDCEILNNGTGYFSASGGKNMVANCYIAGNELGLYIQHEPFIVFDSSICENTSCGLRFTDSDGYICNCSFSSNFVGAMALAGSSGVLTGNTFEESEEDAVFIKESDALIILDNIMADGEEIYTAESAEQ